MPLKEASLLENSYAFDQVRSQLPSPMGAIDLNSQLIFNDMPIIGKGAPFRLVLYP